MYNNRNGGRGGRSGGGYGSRGSRGGGGGASYVWRVTWCNMNVRNGAYQYKCFRNKQDALIFIAKLENNPYNNVSYGSPEKWFGD